MKPKAIASFNFKDDFDNLSQFATQEDDVTAADKSSSAAFPANQTVKKGGKSALSARKVAPASSTVKNTAHLAKKSSQKPPSNDKTHSASDVHQAKKSRKK